MPNSTYKTILLAAFLVLSGCTLNEGDVRKIDDTNPHNTDRDPVTASCEPKCELGFECINAACEAVCGDGIVKGNEECDDHNRKSFDGCSELCILEVRAGCTGNGDCKQLCGDGKIIGTETCDDGNSDDGDGCSRSCKIEDGWDCSSGKCKPICGDGKIIGTETCDDGNSNDDDGCNAACEITEGYRCPAAGQDCEKIPVEEKVKGRKCQSPYSAYRNAVPPVCVDGNNLDGDGCSSDCFTEEGYQCTSFGCAKSCGNGIVGDDEQCDDGNNVNGDGCSSTCEIEPNSTCSDFISNRIDLPVVYRSIKLGESSTPGSTCDGGLTLIDVPGFKKKVPQCPGSAGITYASLFTEGTPLVDAFGFQLFGNKYIPRETSVDPYPGSSLRVKSSIIRVYLRYNERQFRDAGVSLKFSGDDDFFVFLNERLSVSHPGVNYIGGASKSFTFPDILTHQVDPILGTQTFEDGDIIELSYFEVNRWKGAAIYLELPAGAIVGPSYCTRTHP